MAINPDSTTFRAGVLSALLARHYPRATPYSVAIVVSRMQTAARYALNFETDHCNYPMGENAKKRRRNRVEKLQHEINATLRRPELRDTFSIESVGLPATINLGGDPRGTCGILHIPGQSGDGWGEGFAIY